MGKNLGVSFLIGSKGKDRRIISIKSVFLF